MVIFEVGGARSTVLGPFPRERATAGHNHYVALIRECRDGAARVTQEKKRHIAAGKWDGPPTEAGRTGQHLAGRPGL